MNKEARYERIYHQIKELFNKSGNPQARMATICSVLHHKMPGFFWTGFYMIEGEKLMVSTYQGPLACMELARGRGVCWAAIEGNRIMVVPDVHQFPGHIPCDSRSNSEIVVPLKDSNGQIIGVLDVDSTNFDHFDSIDAEWLEKIIKLVA
jgi:GAF domain-containing protein